MSNAKLKQFNALYRATLVRSLHALTRAHGPDHEACHTIRQALDARTLDDAQEWFDAHPKERLSEPQREVVSGRLTHEASSPLKVRALSVRSVYARAIREARELDEMEADDEASEITDADIWAAWSRAKAYHAG